MRLRSICGRLAAYGQARAARIGHLRRPMAGLHSDRPVYRPIDRCVALGVAASLSTCLLRLDARPVQAQTSRDFGLGLIIGDRRA